MGGSPGFRSGGNFNGAGNAFRGNGGQAIRSSAFLGNHNARGLGAPRNLAVNPGRGNFAANLGRGGLNNGNINRGNFNGNFNRGVYTGRANFLNQHNVRWAGTHNFANQWNGGRGLSGNNFAGRFNHGWNNNWNGGNWRNWNGGWRNGGLGHRYWPYYNRNSYGYWGNRFFGFGFFNPFWWGWNSWPYSFPRYGGACWPYFAYTPSLAYGASYAAYPSTTIVDDSSVLPADELRVTPDAATQAPDSSTQQDGSTDGMTSGEFSGLGEQSFRAGDYAAAVRYWRHALVDDPKNGVLVLMLSQALFADGKYDEAAGAVQQGMLMLPEDKWGVVVENFTELYGPGQDYSNQIKSLEKARSATPDNPALRFLLGYQYAYLDYPSNALTELDKAVQLSPDDQIAVKLRDLTKARIGKGTPTRQP
jgi:tetratricopeptide (TPR) repeat protein